MLIQALRVIVLHIQMLSKIKTGCYLDKMQSQNNASPLHPWRWHTSLLEMDSLKVLLFQPTSNACKTSWAPGIVGYKNSVDMNSQCNISLLLILAFTLKQTSRKWKIWIPNDVLSFLNRLNLFLILTYTGQICRLLFWVMDVSKSNDLNSLKKRPNLEFCKVF